MQPMSMEGEDTIDAVRIVSKRPRDESFFYRPKQLTTAVKGLRHVKNHAVNKHRLLDPARIFDRLFGVAFAAIFGASLIVNGLYYPQINPDYS